ncbi:von Willebrand factor A domain-containing protein 7-like isoform X2 [Anneissia japonica]|uniref:von Willebrand factor A domain-containing protein 7-like isoform X2 n=1 Tax=Anneissia japonica TaxID=1529436 RepID=UPI001425832B|nr:von Willebrand factor A domain-containing protein 7-like isoform X2 [Anneissia japonica]
MGLPFLLVIVATPIFTVNGFIPNSWLGLSSPTSKTHAKISEIAILNVAYEFLESNPRPIQPVKQLAKNAPYKSPTKLLKSYYGNGVSTIRFHEAIKDFTDANANVDFDKSSKKLPSAHFDAETFEDSNRRLLRLRQEIISAITAGYYKVGREKTGQLFHTLQDFYSHSNWIEMGNHEPHHSLAVPGAHITNLAEPNTETCDDCGLFGKCKNNILATILTNRKLTSGYCSSQKDRKGKPVVKPEGVGKCSHGGPMDSSGRLYARGGINKDSNNPLISPHYYHHDEATALATDASENILRDIQKVVGNKRFKKYLGLHVGGTMCIVIDTTNSMSDDITAVKNRTRKIIDKRNGTINEPSKFVLVTFSDPASINTTDGGDCREKSFHALRLAIEHTDHHSTCFVFTDASAKDAYLKKSVVALAKYKNVKIKYLLTGSSRGRSQCDTSRHLRAVDSIDSSYADVAFSTGGEVITLSKQEIMAGSSVLDHSLSHSKVTLIYAGQQGFTDVLDGRSHYFIVDSTIDELVITVKGTVINVKIFNPSGDLVKSTGNIFDAVLLLSNIQVTKLVNPTTGKWRVRVRSIVMYSVSVIGTSSVDFSPSFGLEHGGVHPGVEEIVGRPPKGVAVFILINVIGDTAKLGSIEKLEMISPAGQIIKTMTLQTNKEMGKLYAKTILPPEPFQLRVTGSDVIKNQFSRIFRQVVRTSTCSISTDRSDVQQILSAGSIGHIPFKALNSGAPGTYIVSAIDSTDFVRDLKPNRFVLGRNESIEGKVSFAVPKNVRYGTSSTITLVITRDHSAHEFNYFVFDIIIQSQEIDEVPPSFTVVQRSGKCLALENSCNEANFTVAVEIVDVGTGVFNIITAKESDSSGLTLYEFTPGIPGSIARADYRGSCCQPSLELIATDVVGNVGKFKVNVSSEDTNTMQTDDMLLYIVMIKCGIAVLLVVMCACCCCVVYHSKNKSGKRKKNTEIGKKIHREEVTPDKLNPPSCVPDLERYKELYATVETKDKHAK